MIQKSVFVIGVLVILQCYLISLSSAECDITKCGVPKHYREIGCEPSKYAEDDKEKCCPIEYNCDELKKQNDTKCYYRGKTFEDGDQIPDDIHCLASCRCSSGKIECAHIECPTDFNPPPPHCVVQKTAKECCSENTVCEKEEIEKLPVCYMDGKEYRKGQAMYPNGCFTCICDEKFDNSTALSKNPSCNEVDCSIEVHYLTRIRSGCAPVYYGEATCCPIQMKCPSADDKAIPIGRQTTTPVGSSKCKFGDHELQIGDKVTDSNKCVDCECATPPMITCVQKRDC